MAYTAGEDILVGQDRDGLLQIGSLRKIVSQMVEEAVITTLEPTKTVAGSKTLPVEQIHGHGGVKDTRLGKVSLHPYMAVQGTAPGCTEQGHQVVDQSKIRNIIAARDGNRKRQSGMGRPSRFPQTGLGARSIDSLDQG